MKSCLSILVALLILTVFLGTAGLLWYTSASTEMKPGQDVEDVDP